MGARDEIAVPGDGYSGPTRYVPDVLVCACGEVIDECPACDQPLEQVSWEEGFLSFWHEEPLRDGWIVAHRLVVKNGKTIIGETRVFPHEPDRPQRGEWSGAADGFRAVVPQGGVTTGLLRSIRVPDHVLAAIDIAKQYDARGPSGVTKIPGTEVEIYEILDVGGHAVEETAEKRRGQPRIPDQQLAEFARDYVKLCTDGQSPRPRLAEIWSLSISGVDKRLHAARDRGFLSGGSQGRPGGTLTARAIGLLATATSATVETPRT